MQMQNETSAQRTLIQKSFSRCLEILTEERANQSSYITINAVRCNERCMLVSLIVIGNGVFLRENREFRLVGFPLWGCRDRWFKSSRPDYFSNPASCLNAALRHLDVPGEENFASGRPLVAPLAFRRSGDRTPTRSSGVGRNCVVLSPWWKTRCFLNKSKHLFLAGHAGRSPSGLAG